MFQQIMDYFSSSSDQYWQYVGEHLTLSIQALLISCLIGMPLGYICYRNKKLSQFITFSAQALRIIPSLAVLFLLIPVIGVGRTPAIIALVFLGTPPVLINTTLGFNEIPEVMIETASGLGMNAGQLFRKIKVPLAFPYLMNGVKISLVEIIASATLATYIGAGGLGTIIFTGLGLYRVDLLLIGGISVAILSFGSTLIMDFIIKRREYN